MQFSRPAPAPAARLVPAVPARLIAIVLSLLLAGIPACATRPGSIHVFIEPAMGIAARILVAARDEDEVRPAVRAAFDRIAEIESALSDWRDDSEVMRLTARGRGTWHAGDDLRRVIARSIEMHAATRGAFDPSVGPLTVLWRGARRRGELPTAEAQRDARMRGGLDGVHVDDAQGVIVLPRDRMRFDFGGIGKGDAADQALAVLRDLGFPAALVDLGGDIAIGAAPPGRPGWTIEIDSSSESSGESSIAHPSPERLLLTDCGVATSGDREQHLAVAPGVACSHIIDPRTGTPVTRRIGVTVIAGDAATADALASALSVLGPADGAAILTLFRGAAARYDIHSGHGVMRGWSGSIPSPAPLRILSPRP